MAEIVEQPEKPTLYVCHIDNGGVPMHACRVAQEALREAGVDFDKVVYARNRPFGWFTTGHRPELKAASGQEKLPTLQLPDGTWVNGSRDIRAWAQAQK
jgi:Glutathione S-transferase, N-terminal domain